ncbi:MAG: MCE family protein [Oligoflexia bacterium]|nr:MCE family protein [Oligoflexia bacterium]
MSREVKVGIFVTVLMALLAVSIFVLGGSTDLLETRYKLNGAWADVAGLQEGAVVRLAGIDIGEVSKVQISQDLGVKQIMVEMTVMDRYQERIRADSVARIDTVGVLGDKYVAITMGSMDKAVLVDGGWMTTQAPLDILEYTKKLQGILESTGSIGKKVDLMLGSDDAAAQASLSQSFSHIEEIVNRAKVGPGLAYTLVYDENTVKRVDHILGNLDDASSDLSAMTDEIRHGDGMAHEIIYGSGGQELTHQLKDIAAAMGQLTNDIKNDNSVLHALIYDPEKAKMVDDLALTASSMARTAKAIEDGEGTMGLLARDPALYEDLRALVGGAQRNKLLRAYIRHTVQRGETNNAAPWEPPK